MQEHVKGTEHRIVLESRKQLCLSGVEKVQSFASKEIMLETIQGLLSVKGEGLEIKHLDLEGKIVEIEGIVDALTYSRHAKEARQNILGRIFR